MKPIPPGPGQESVWDYPRPPRLEASSAAIRIVVGDATVVDSNATYRLLETSHPPVYYVPPDDTDLTAIQPATQKTFCEWKGVATYFDLVLPDRRIHNAAWTYRSPSKKYAEIKDYLAFYPSKMDACFVNDERVESQEGDFYGGWITSQVVGPFKGAPGTHRW